jgi:DNA repair photolyase
MATAPTIPALFETQQRRLARHPTLCFLPATPKANVPEPRAGDSAPVSTGPGGNLPEEAAAPCPVPRTAAAWSKGANGRNRKAPAGLVGIARLAFSSTAAPTARRSEDRPEYYFLPVRSMLNRCDSNRVPFEWTINPYRGCEFACRYCYARYTHEYMELDGGEFERKIFVKQNASALLARDLSANYGFGPSATDPHAPEHIAIGTATDPYQPAEREFGATRACLEELARREGLSVSITTKSNQILRDIAVLQKIAARSTVYINITVTTLRPRLARLLEPRAPQPDLRLAAVQALREAGFATGVFLSPILPGITDSEENLEAVAQGARGAGALWLAGGVVFLMPASQKIFFPFLDARFPKLARRYREWFTRNGYAPEAYRKQMSERMARLRANYGLGARPWEAQQREWHSPQLLLALEAGAEGTPRARPRSCSGG